MTFKQMKAIKAVVEDGLNIYQAKLKAGYSKTQAKKTDRLTKSDAWREVMNEYLPDYKLFKKHEEALEATKWNDFTGEREQDHYIRLRAIDMAYKLKGRVGENGGNSYQQINISLDSGGYIPPTNVLGIKSTLGLGRKPKPKTIDQSSIK